MKNKLNLTDMKKYLNIETESTTAKINLTPKQAKFILRNSNKANRSIKYQHVDRLKRDMENNNWYLDTDYIGFNSDGILVNGQHRLKALAKANVEFITLKFDFDVEQHISMDTGSSRTYTDHVNISLKTNKDIMPNKYKNIITAGIKLTNSKISLSNTELCDIWHKYSNDIMLCEQNNLFNLGSISSNIVKSSLLWAYLSGESIENLNKIARTLRDGITESELDIPIIRLRDALYKMKPKTKHSDNIKKAEYTQQCIFNFSKGIAGNRLPSNCKMRYQDFNILDNINI